MCFYAHFMSVIHISLGSRDINRHLGQDKGYAGKDHRLSVEWANGQQAKEKHDIAHVHKALGAVSERSTDTFQAELDGVSECGSITWRHCIFLQCIAHLCKQYQSILNSCGKKGPKLLRSTIIDIRFAKL